MLGTSALRKFALPFFRESGDVLRQSIDVEGMGIEVFAEPIADFLVAFVLFVADRLQHLGVAPGAADIFRRSSRRSLR